LEVRQNGDKARWWLQPKELDNKGKANGTCASKRGLLSTNAKGTERRREKKNWGSNLATR